MRTDASSWSSRAVSPASVAIGARNEASMAGGSALARAGGAGGAEGADDGGAGGVGEGSALTGSLSLAQLSA